MKITPLLALLLICSMSFGQLAAKKEFGKLDKISLFHEAPILDYNKDKINLYLEKPKPRKRTDENKPFKTATIAGGIVFGSVLTLNYLGSEDKKEETTAYWCMMGGILVLCTTIQIVF